MNFHREVRRLEATLRGRGTWDETGTGAGERKTTVRTYLDLDPFLFSSSNSVNNCASRARQKGSQAHSCSQFTARPLLLRTPAVHRRNAQCLNDWNVFSAGRLVEVSAAIPEEYQLRKQMRQQGGQCWLLAVLGPYLLRRSRLCSVFQCSLSKEPRPQMHCDDPPYNARLFTRAAHEAKKSNSPRSF